MQHRVLAVAILLSSVASAATAQTAVSWEFPSSDWRFAGAASRARERRALEQAAAAGDRVAAMELLSLRGRHREALEIFTGIVDNDPDQLPAAVKIAGRVFPLALRDRASGFGEALTAVLGRVPASLDALPREIASEAALDLVELEWHITPRDRGASTRRRREFVDRYAGTAAAARVSLELLYDDAHGEDRVRLLARYAREHPGTALGAKALHDAAGTLANNAPDGERDPTARFFRVHGMATELSSGAWPDSEWTDNAVSLIAGFSERRPTYAPGNLERVLNAYDGVIVAQLRDADVPEAVDRVAHLMTSRLPRMLRELGWPDARIDARFDHWAAASGRADAVRYLQGAMYARLRIDYPKTRETATVRAREIFSALEASGRGLYERRALAELAVLEAQGREHERAAAAFERYLEAYPSTDYAWVAALRLGQTRELRGDWAGARKAYERGASAPGAPPEARVVGWFNAARAREAEGDLEAARQAYRTARAAWTAGVADRVALGIHDLDAPFGALPHPSAANITAALLDDEVARLDRGLSLAGGPALERGRWLLREGDWKAAIEALGAFLSAYPDSPAAREARELRNLARVQQALAVADTESASSDPGSALQALDAVAAEPWDVAVGLAELAAVSLRHTLPGADPAAIEAALESALRRWHRNQMAPPGRTTLDDGLLEDVAEIRRLVYLPAGGEIYSQGRWNAFKFPARAPKFHLVDPDVRVRLHEGAAPRTIRVFRAESEISNVLFADVRARQMMAAILTRLGGTRSRQPAHVMETPNQPVGGSMLILSLWNRYFPVRPGHWTGWDLETFPVVTEIVFYDAARTRAGAKVTIGYSGATVMLEKAGGVWRAVKLTNTWVT